MTKTTRGLYEICGIELECKFIETVKTNSPTLVLLHEGLGSVALWKGFPEQLHKATGCPVLAYSRQGHGASAKAELPRPTKYMHHEGDVILPGVMDYFNITNTVLIGHSDGASIALIHAGSTQEQRIKALILLAPHVFVEDITIQSIQKAKYAFQNSDLPDKLAKYHELDIEHVFRGWNDIWLHPEFKDWNIEEYLPQINIPLLVIQGRQDQYGTMLQVEKILRQVHGLASCSIFENCQHSPHADQKDLTIKAITQYVNNL